MSIEIVKPVPEDAEEISSLYATTWLATYLNAEHGITVADIEIHNAKRKSPERIERLQNYLAEEMNNPAQFYVIAKDDGRIVGVCNALEKDEFVQLASIYVLPGEQGKGVGSELMKAMLVWTNPQKPIKLHVVSYNQTAIHFYERWGFAITGEEFTDERFQMASGSYLPEIEMVREVDSSI